MAASVLCPEKGFEYSELSELLYERLADRNVRRNKDDRGMACDATEGSFGVHYRFYWSLLNILN